MATSIEELKGDIIKLNAKADKILDILVNKVTVVKNTAFLNLDQDTPDIVENNIFPIKSLEALNSLNDKLSENNFFKSTIKQFSKEYIGAGYTWKKISYILIDKLVERQTVLWNCKSGRSSLYSIKSQDFFKHSILRYSDARATAAVKGLKRTSTPRVSVSRKKRSINLSLEEAIGVLLEDKENADIHFEDEIFETE
ncbi:hypothetical protein JTB14_011609 [Gonioctena quinquepunctata]|nr:hypothetical protein JTB14_011609 [Gonioctena quinquepunctata]